MFSTCCWVGMLSGYFFRLRNSHNLKCAESWVSLIVFFMVLFFNDSNVLVESEYRAGKQERLGHVVEQACGDVVDHDDLISHQRDAAHDEQHRTGVLRDFKARVFHSNC